MGDGRSALFDSSTIDHQASRPGILPTPRLQAIDAPEKCNEPGDRAGRAHRVAGSGRWAVLGTAGFGFVTGGSASARIGQLAAPAPGDALQAATLGPRVGRVARANGDGLGVGRSLAGDDDGHPPPLPDRLRPTRRQPVGGRAAHQRAHNDHAEDCPVAPGHGTLGCDRQDEPEPQGDHPDDHATHRGDESAIGGVVGPGRDGEQGGMGELVRRHGRTVSVTLGRALRGAAERGRLVGVSFSVLDRNLGRGDQGVNRGRGDRPVVARVGLGYRERRVFSDLAPRPILRRSGLRP
jgi:hypothetical protein